jgi:hypothetical protein
MFDEDMGHLNEDKENHLNMVVMHRVQSANNIS